MNHGDDASGAIQERVRQALAENAALKIFAGRTKSFLGRQHDGIPLDLSALTGVVSYEPNELILVARPGTKLNEIEALCRSENQYFAFEPPAWGAAATIGGTVACNLSGPRRFKMGALRDHLLGAELIDGRGERIRTGGKVVKNVTGYDLSKVLAGSFGTLGVLTEVCLKVWPRPETQATLFVHGLTPATALARILDWAARPLQITGLVCDADRLAARVEGPASAVRAQLATLREEESAESEDRRRGRITRLLAALARARMAGPDRRPTALALFWTADQDGTANRGARGRGPEPLGAGLGRRLAVGAVAHSRPSFALAPHRSAPPNHRLALCSRRAQ